MKSHREILRGLAWAYPHESVLLYHYRVQERRRLDWETGLVAIGEVDQAVLSNIRPRIVFDQHIPKESPVWKGFRNMTRL